MKFYFHRIVFIVITLVIFIGCKKDKKEVTYTHSSYIGDTDKRLPDSPPVRYTNNSLYVTTSSEKEIEITLNTDAVIKYKDKFEIWTGNGIIFSGKRTTREEISIQLQSLPNDILVFSYSSKEISTGKTTSYTFVGTEQP